MSATTLKRAAEGRTPRCLPLRSLLKQVDRLSFLTLVAGFAAMVLLVSVQVFMRYALSSSIDSAAELSRLFFVWTIFLALPHGICRGVHVGIDALVCKFPEKLQHWCWRLTTALSLVLMLALSWLAWGAIQDKWQELMPTLDVTAAVYYIPVLICALHSVLHLLLQLLEDTPPEQPEVQ